MSPVQLNHIYETHLNNCIGHSDNVCKWLEDTEAIHTVTVAYVHQEQLCDLQVAYSRERAWQSQKGKD